MISRKTTDSYTVVAIEQECAGDMHKCMTGEYFLTAFPLLLSFDLYLIMQAGAKFGIRL